MAERQRTIVLRSIEGPRSASPIFREGSISDSRIARRFRAGQALCTLGICLVSLVLMSGCGEPRRKVVATWRGQFIEERQTDEKIELSPPAISAVAVNPKPGSFQLDTLQTELTTYSLEKRYEQVAAVRKLSPEQAERLRGDAVKSANVGVFLAGMWLVPPIGASVTAGAAGLDKKKAEKRELAQAEAIEKLKEGESNVAVPLDFRWSTIKTEYEREAVGEEVEPAGFGSEEKTVAAARVPLRIVNLQDPAQQVEAYTDDAGRVSFSLAKTLAEAAALKPGRWRISAKWQGQWHEVAVVDVSPEWIEQTVSAFRERKLQAKGKSELPPAAEISLKVSDGCFRAGMQSDISLTVLNTGPGTFYRLVAVTESDVPALNGLEFDFGKLDAGEGLTLVRRISIPRRQPSTSVPVRFRWTELNGYAPESVDAQIPIKAP